MELSGFMLRRISVICRLYRSTNLVDWSFQGTAFTDNTRPHFVPNGKPLRTRYQSD